MSRKSTNVLELGPLFELNRLLSAPEYYHACIGSNPHTTVPPREIVIVLEGEFTGIKIDWQKALDKVVAMNPGTRLRLIGKRRNARWVSNGVPPSIRIIEQCDWDGRSENGAGFIKSTRLSLDAGPTAELIIAGEGNDAKIIIRVLHAAMDGMGVMHFMQELFRALRDEPLSGTNAPFSDVDLMLSVATEVQWQKMIRPASLTEDAQGNEIGYTWRRVSIHGHGSQPNLMARIALAMAEFSRLSSGLPVRFAVPVDLRHHFPGLLSTMNFSIIIYVDVIEGDTAIDIRDRLRKMLERKVDADYRSSIDLIRYLPFDWLDWLVSPRRKKHTPPIIMETAVISNLGGYRKNDLSFPGFNARSLYGIPIEGSPFLSIFKLQGRIEITIGMARVLAGGGRLEAFVEFLENYLKAGKT